MNNNFKKIAFGDSFKRFSQWYRKVFYTFLYCKKIAFPPLAGSAIGVIGDNLRLIFFLILCLLPLKLLAADQVPQVSFAGSKATISMDFQDANLKDVIKIFSIQSGLNLSLIHI